MEKVYYKGKIIDTSKLEKIELLIGDLKNIGISKTADKFKKYLDTLKYGVVDELSNKLKNVINNDILSFSNSVFDGLNQFINDMLMECYIKKYSQDSREIIFEVITTKGGDLYGKELYTGLLFPIVSKNKTKCKIVRYNHKHVIKKDNSDEVFFVKCDTEQYYIDSSYAVENTNRCINATYYEAEGTFIKPYFYNMDLHFKAHPIKLTTYTVVPVVDKFENLDLCEAIIFNPMLANQNEVDKYYQNISGFAMTVFGVKRKIINEIKKLYNKNVFNSPIEEKAEIKEVLKPKAEKDPMTLKIENIEYLLAILKQKNIESYESFAAEYDQMISSETEPLTLNPLTIQNLTLLEGRIEIYLEYAKNDVTHISELLSNLKAEYLENLQNETERTTKLTIPDIDKINELFLKTKSQYSVKDALMIQKDIAFLYIMELIEDKDIKVSDLENSYFIDNLKYIMITIIALIEEGILENSSFIDFETNLDLYSVFNVIRNLEINKINKKIKE